MTGQQQSVRNTALTQHKFGLHEESVFKESN